MNFQIVSVVFSLAFSITLSAFDSYEHIATGTMGVRLTFPSDQQMFEDFPYKPYYDMLLDSNNKAKVGKIEYYPQYLMIREGKKSIKLSYGEIIALAGDFIGMTDGVISQDVDIKDFERYRNELEKNFHKAFNFLLPFDGNSVYQNNNLEYLRGLFKNEYKSLIIALNKKYGVHFNSASSHSVTSKVKDQWAYAKSPGYADMLSINVDHFGNEAKISYAIGHTLALEKAKEAFLLEQKGDRDGAVDVLNLAYAMDAFGSHYLTDLFSSGHLRTPRNGLLDVSKSLKNRAVGYTVTNVGLMANAMHDEDNYTGLWLKNGPGQVWKAYGDGSYFDVKSEDNREAIKDALQASVDEVYKAYQTGIVPKYRDFKALKLVGTPLESGSDFINHLVNPFPLFKLGKMWPEVRKNYYDNAVSDYQAITNVTGISSFIKSDLGTFNHSNFHSFLMEAHLGESLKRDVIVECYNTFDRESIWPSKPRDYVTLGEHANVIAINNKELQFYKSMLLGNLRPDGIFYAVNEDYGQKIINQCKHAMETNFKLNEANRPEVIEIRGRIDRGYSHPIVVFDKDGKLRRLLGYKNL
jgi:hypothetical protein